MEFDRFVQSADRLYILALERAGNLVVEIKRDAVAGYADLQAIWYAAMVSSMTIEKAGSLLCGVQEKTTRGTSQRSTTERMIGIDEP